MEAEYDFSDGLPNPYAARFNEAGAVIVLDCDVAAAFPDSQSVNEALRLLIKAAKGAAKLSKAS